MRIAVRKWRIRVEFAPPRVRPLRTMESGAGMGHAVRVGPADWIADPRSMRHTFAVQLLFSRPPELVGCAGPSTCPKAWT